MRTIAPPILIAAFLIAISIALAAVAATFAVARPARAEIEADLASYLSADYSAGLGERSLAPLDPEIVTIARNDQVGPSNDPDAEIVEVFYSDPPDPDDANDIFVSPSPTPAVTGGPETPPPPGNTPRPRTPTPRPGQTPEPTTEATPTPGGNVTPGATPRPATPTQAPTPTPKPPATPSPSPPPTPGVLYLHNNPSPPVGSTVSHHDLTCDPAAPTATTLFNYDTDRDNGPGRVIARGGAGPNEPDPNKHQHWRTPALNTSLVVQGNVKVELWTAVKDFAVGESVSGTVYVGDYFGGSSTPVAQGGFTISGTGSWTLVTTFINVSGTLPAGHALELTVVVNNASQDDLWVAYDTTAYQSRIVMP